MYSICFKGRYIDSLEIHRTRNYLEIVYNLFNDLISNEISHIIIIKTFNNYKLIGQTQCNFIHIYVNHILEEIY